MYNANYKYFRKFSSALFGEIDQKLKKLNYH